MKIYLLAIKSYGDYIENRSFETNRPEYDFYSVYNALFAEKLLLD